MTSIDFDDDPDADNIKRAIDRIQKTGTIPRGISGDRSFEYDEDSDTLKVNFTNLTRVLLEHRIFEEADGFSPTKIRILRIIEEGPDRMRFSEIRAEVNGGSNGSGETSDDTIEDSTLQYYLRDLREKELIEHARNQYTYIGP